MLLERTNVIASFPEHPVYSNFEMFSALILEFLFWLVVTYPKRMCKINLFFVILGVPRRKNDTASFSWSTRHKAISKCLVSWFYFFYFHFPLFTQNTPVKVIFSWNLGAPRKEQCYCIFRGAPCIQQFQNV